jgi:hypothetical protein
MSILRALHAWRSRRAAEKAVRRLHAKLTPAYVEEIIGRVGAHVADRKARYLPVSQLPFPRAVVEVAFLKALQEWPDGPRLETLRAFYLGLDDCMLPDAEAAVLNQFNDLVKLGAELLQRPPDPNDPVDRTLVDMVASQESHFAIGLMTTMHERLLERAETLNRIKGRRPQQT